MFEDCKYQNVFENFAKICAIPHGSYHEKAISDYLYQFASEHGYEAVQDEALNVLVRIPASEGREAEPSLLLQGHMDMVCEKNADVLHDFLKDPIRLRREGDWLMAQGTTLGGDDGIAIAYMMTLIEDPSVSHPTLELLMTVSEETGMDGAKNLDKSILRSKRMINLDSEEEGVFIAGGAGGLKVEVTHTLERAAAPADFIPLEVKTTGFIGGHSGEDINKRRGNANAILGEYLLGWYNYCPNTRLVSLDGGSKDNAIPREACAKMWIPAGMLDQAERGCWWFGEDLAKEYADSDPGALITMRRANPAAEPGWEWFPMNSTITGEVINFLHLCPTGVRSMSQELTGMVESSQNLAVLHTEEDVWSARISLRSNLDSLLPTMVNRLHLMAEMSGMDCEAGGQYPAWNYRAESPLRSQMAEIYHKMYGHNPEVLILHAGLECGIFAEAIPNMDMVSIGPDMQGIHSPDEKLNIPSVERCWEFLLRVLAEV